MYNCIVLELLEDAWKSYVFVDFALISCLSVVRANGLRKGAFIVDLRAALEGGYT